jgi:hypothetical protein
MAGRNEGCASIGCLGLVVVLIVGMCTGNESSGGSSSTYPPAYPSYPSAPSPSVPQETREWLYIHGTLNVRAEPNKNAPILRTLSRGDMVQLGTRQPNGWARIYTGASEDEYVYRASDLVRADPPGLPAAAATSGRTLHVGPRGGCYYMSDSGRKMYVDRAECSRAGVSAAPQPLISRGSGSSARRSGSRQLHRGPRGGCYYINGNGNKTYVDRSECN